MDLTIKRLTAGLIDHAVSCYVSVMLVFVITKGTAAVTLVSVTAFLITYLLTIIFRDVVFKNASVGKKIMRLKLVKRNAVNDPYGITFKHCLQRGLTFIFLMPVEVILLLYRGVRLGDTLSDTIVVSK